MSKEEAMRKATRVVAALLGVFAGIGGPEHGIFEIMRGNTRPGSLIIVSMGPPCNPEEVWHACEPAMTVIPNFLVTGILATIVGLITIVWAAGFLKRKRGGVVLILLSIALLLVGGGLFPPVIGIVAGVVGTRINVPPAQRTSRLSRFLAALWPWPLVAFFVWTFGQFVFGYFFNELLMRSGYVSPLMIVGLMVLSIVSAFAYDAQHAEAA
jgi:hypothetical protein